MEYKKETLNSIPTLSNFEEMEETIKEEIAKVNSLYEIKYKLKQDLEIFLKNNYEFSVKIQE